MKAWLVVVTLGLARAQESAPPHAPTGAASHEHEKHEGPTAFEAEFAASDIFRSGSYLQPLWRGLGFEGHYFAGENTETGYAGASWTFRMRELKLSPGFGVMFGNNQFASTPALSFRWDYEKKWLVTQGLVLHGFRETPVFAEEEGGEHHGPPVTISYVRPMIADGSHVSARWKRLTVGGTWEHIQFREGVEWKGGGRLAIRLFPRLSALLYVFGPGRAEWRGGVLIHPRQAE